MPETTETFRTVYADPAWYEQGGGQITRGAQKHYPLIKTKDIPGVMMEDCEYWEQVDETAHLYMWVTNNFLMDGGWVMKELGFRYITNRAWAKDRFGLGQYYRGQHELLLFGVRGRGYDNLKARGQLSTLIGGGILPRGKHSKKPEQVYEDIEKVSAGPYLEMFAREEREGWTSGGPHEGLI